MACTCSVVRVLALNEAFGRMRSVVATQRRVMPAMASQRALVRSSEGEVVSVSLRMGCVPARLCTAAPAWALRSLVYAVGMLHNASLGWVQAKPMLHHFVLIHFGFNPRANLWALGLLFIHMAVFN